MLRYDGSRSFKVIEIGTNRKPICDFLLVFRCNYGCGYVRLWFRAFVRSSVCPWLRRETSSPAVAERPRDASHLSVGLVSFNSTIRRAQSSVIRYFRFRFTAAYNSVLFSSLRRGRPCWL